MMAKGMLHRFHATSADECLVMLRIGTPNFQGQAKDDRTGADGKPLIGDTKANRSVPIVFRDGGYFGD